MSEPTYPYELIGEEIEIIRSQNQEQIGIKGSIIDETKHSLKININKKIKIILKKN